HRVRCLGARRRAGDLPPRAGLRRGGRLLREPPGLLGAAQRLLGLALLLQAERLGLGPQPGLLLGLLAAAVLLRLAAGLLLGACLLLREEPLPLLLGAAGGFLGALPGLLRLPFRLTPLGLLGLAPLALLLLGTQARELLLALTLQSLLLGLARRLFLRLAAGFLLGLAAGLLAGLDLGLGQRQHLVQPVPDHGGDGLRLLAGVDHQVAAGVGRGQGEETGPHACVELGGLRLQPVRGLREPL